MRHDRPLDLRVQDALDAQSTAGHPRIDYLELTDWRDETARLREGLQRLAEMLVCAEAYAQDHSQPSYELQMGGPGGALTDSEVAELSKNVIAQVLDEVGDRGG